MEAIVDHAVWKPSYPTFMEQRVWGFEDEANLINLQYEKTQYAWKVDTRLLMRYVLSIHPHIANYSHVFPHRSIPEVIYKIQHLIQRFRQFQMLINMLDIKYNEATNTITAGQDYFMIVGEKNEEPRNLWFMRKHPLKKFGEVKTIFMEKGVEKVDFVWLLWACSSNSVGLPLGEPLDG